MKDITTALSQEADFYPLFSEQAEQHFSPLLVVRSVKQRVQISLWNLSLFFFPLSSHRSLDKRNLTDSVLFVVSSYSPPLIIPSFGHSEAEVCYYLHPFSTLLSNLFPFFFFFLSLPGRWIRCVLLSAEGEWDGERDEKNKKRTSCVHCSPLFLCLCSNLIESCWIDWQGNEFGGACVRFQTEWGLFTSRHPRRTPAPRSFSHRLSF